MRSDTNRRVGGTAFQTDDTLLMWFDLVWGETCPLPASDAFGGRIKLESDEASVISPLCLGTYVTQLPDSSEEPDSRDEVSFQNTPGGKEFRLKLRERRRASYCW
jgi:hypothetical protein